MRYINNQLQIKKTDTPIHAAHQVLVAVSAFGINRADVMQRSGQYPPIAGESEVLGLEVAGEVIGCGPSVTRWQLGDRVCGLVAGGGYAEKAVISEQHLLAVPDNMELQTAAGLTEVFVTAYQALVSIANARAGERVLIHAGASGLGLAAIQIAQLMGCDVAVTVSSSKKQSVCRQLGANICIQRNDADFVEVLKDKWPEGVDIVIDVVGGDYINRNMQIMRMDGRIISLAIMGNRIVEQFDMARLLAKRISLHGSTLRNRSNLYKAKLIQQFEHDIMPAFDDEEIIVPMDTVYPVQQISEAHARIEANDTQGKLVCYW